jgi:hypothetical protein
VGQPVPPAPVSPLEPTDQQSPTAAANPEKKNPPAGYSRATGFIIQSEDGANRLRIGMTAGYRFEPVYQNGEWLDRNAFFVLRPFIGGNFFKEWIHFWTSFEFASNPPYVLDTYVEANPWKELGLRVGQFWTPFDRHEYLGPQEILFPDWAAVSEYFWTGRDKGAMVLGTVADQLEYWAGVFSGTPLRQYNALPGNYVLEARVTWSPLGLIASNEFPYITDENGAPFKVSATIEGYYGKVQEAEQNFNPSTFRFETEATGLTNKQGAGSADLWLQGRYFAFLTEWFVRRTEPAMGAKFTSVGGWGQIGVPIVERTMDIATRINWLNASTDLSNDQFYSIEGQVAYYATKSQHLVIKARYAYGHQDSPGMAALGSVPLILPAGRTQLFTLQLNLAF